MSQLVCFQAIKEILDEFFHGHSAADAAEVDGRVHDALVRLSEAVNHLAPDRQPDYENLHVRVAYAHLYVASHAHYLSQVLDRHRDHVAGLYVSSQGLRVHCMGGGPGSDALGVAKFLLRARTFPCVTLRTFDRCSSWGRLNGRINAKIAACHVRPGATWTASFDANHSPDKPITWQPGADHLAADLFTMMYCMSELSQQGEAGTRYMDNLLGCMRPGAVLVMIDNAHSKFLRWFDAIAKEHAADVVSAVNDESFVIRDTLEKFPILEDYTRRFGRQPKTRSQLAYRVLVRRG